MNFIISLLVFFEILLLITALTFYYSSKKYQFTDSLVYSIIITFAVYSVSIQIFFIFGWWSYFFIFDIIVLIFSFFLIIKLREQFKQIREIIFIFYKNNTLYFVFFSLIFTYLFFQAFLLPPYNWDSMTYNLARVLIFQNDNTLFLNNYTTIRQVILPYGYDILHFMYLRFYSDFGVATFGYLSYIVVVLSTYSIVKKYFNDTKYALFITFIVSSFTQFILQSTNTKNDIPLAAITIVIIIAAINYFQRGRLSDVFIIIIGAAFGISIKSYYPAFALPFIVFFVVYIFFQKNSKLDFKKSFKEWKDNKAYILLLFSLSVLIFMFYHNNYMTFGGISGPKEFVSLSINSDGILGGIVNIYRYLIQLINLPSEFLGKAISDFFNTHLLGSLATVNANAKVPLLSSTAIPDEGQSFYGLLANILIFPSLVYSLFKGNTFLKIVSLSLIIFFLGICFSLKWDLFRARFFMTFFAGSGIAFAFLIYKIYNNNGILKKIILTIAILNMSYVVLFNNNKPFPFVYDGIKVAIEKFHINKTFDREGSWIDWALNRDYNYDRIYGQRGTLKEITNLIKGNSKVLFLGTNGSWVFPIMLRQHHAHYTLTGKDTFNVKNKLYNIKKDTSFIKNYFDYILIQRRTDIRFSFTKLIFESHSKYSNIYLHKILR